MHESPCSIYNKINKKKNKRLLKLVIFKIVLYGLEYHFENPSEMCPERNVVLSNK